MPSIKEMRQVCQTKIPNKKGKMVYADHWWARYVTRHYSIYMTWLFVKLGISANAVTVLMIISGLVGIVLCIPHFLWMNVIGLILLYLFEALDCSDGEVARWTKKSSMRGVFLDMIAHVICNHPMKAILGLNLYFLTQNVLYAFIAFITYAASISAHSLYKCRCQLDLDTLKKGLALNSIANKSDSKIWRYVKLLFGLLVEPVYYMVFLPVPILGLYFGLEYYVGILVWICMFIHLIMFLVVALDYYYFDLLDVSHVKRHDLVKPIL